MSIETERLILRNYRIEDLNDYWEYVTQPNVGPRCGWQPYTDIEAAKERLLLECAKPLQFAITLKDTGKVIGSIEIMDAKREEINDKVKEIGCLLHEGYWGKGYMTEAFRAIVKYCFDNLGVDKVIAAYFEHNIGSAKMQIKSGLTEYKKIEKYIKWYLTGELCDIVVTKIEREEYKENPIYKNLNICVREDRGR